MAELRPVSVDVLAARLASLRGPWPAPAPADAGAARWAYREGAALLGSFRAGSVLPSAGPRDKDALRAMISEDCERVATPDGHRWRLRLELRHAALERLATADRMLGVLAAAAPDPLDVGRTMAEAYLRRAAPPLDRQTIDQLHGTLQAAEWLAPTEVEVPTAEAVRGRITVANLLLPLRRLVGDSFVGREAELARLEAYAGGGDAPAARLVIHGPGGVGKSTLVARFVLDRVEGVPGRRMPFAYLSFDRDDLVPARPLTLLAEAARQLGALYPEIAADASSLESAIRSTLLSLSAVSQDRGPASKSSSGVARAAGRDEYGLLSRFGALVEAGAGRVPVLWVLDTFEQAQRRGPLAVDRVWDFLDELQSVVPALRVVIAGRARLDAYETDDLALLGFDHALALSFLRRELRDLKATDDFLRSVIRQVHGNPLSLKLAAELIRREGESGLRSITTRRRILFKVGAEEIQGLLYRRILDHLDDPDLRRIANPGLVVRYVTPEIIAEVLAVPCGLGRIDENRAQELFDALEFEASLFEPVDFDVVVHRQDVRKTMLPLLARDRPKKVRTIHQRAVRYYAGLTGPRARAEELYHRLSLGQPTATLDKRWDAAAGALLESALDELPPAGRVYLTDRLGLPPDPEALAQADDEAWARQAVRVARELLDARRPADALELLRTRPRNSARAAVTGLEVEALAYLGRADEALSLAKGSLTWAAEEGRTATFVELAVLGARVAEDAGRFAVAARYLDQARAAAEAQGDPIVHLAGGVALLRVQRRSGRAATASSRRLKDEVVAASRRLTRTEKMRHPSLVRDLAAEIGDARPELVVEAAKLVGVDIGGAAGRTLANLLSSDDIDGFVSFVRDNFDEPPAEGPAPEPAPALQKAAAGQTAAEQGERVSRYLEEVEDNSWNNALSEVFRGDADQAAFEL